jgi:4-hydroxythreonine-4-phosphate dehydrogenase
MADFAPAVFRLALTQGDPCGIGPEIVVKALLKWQSDLPCPLVLIGDPAVLQEAGRRFTSGKTQKFLASAATIGPGDPLPAPEQAPLVILSVSRLDPARLKPGAPGPEEGKAMRAAIEAGVRLCRSGGADALVTGPITKAAMLAGGSQHGGHTELLAELLGVERPVMMLMNDRLRVVLATTHLPLAEVPKRLSAEALLHLLRVTDQGLRQDLGIEKPRLLVAGLNPHAGEGGRLGREDQEVIAPAVARARAEGIAAEGPLAADSLFARALRERADAVVCMYHDQGLAPLKMLDFENTVQVTLGLPIVRTSVGHGSAPDIAGQGRASPQSLLRAVEWALKIAKRRKGTRIVGSRQ